MNPADKPAQLADDDFELVRRVMKEAAGISLPAGKEYLVESRILMLVKSDRIESSQHLFREVRDGSRAAIELLVDAMTTNETSFFRDATPFEALRDAILPALVKERMPQRQLRIWCAASSSGQEPITIAMIIRENFPELAGWDVKILATDISLTMLERCRSGVYSQLEVSRGLPAQLLVRYFKKVGVKWKVGDGIRDMIEYRHVNLAEALPELPAMDLILVRNVLIYFDEETKHDVLGRVLRKLSPGGFLMLGTAESLQLEALTRRKYRTSTYYQAAA